jgi:hypothetical protein
MDLSLYANNQSDDPDKTQFQAAEDFARYIHQRWIHRNKSLSVSNTTISNRSTTKEQQRIQWSFVIFIAIDDHMVYIARPTAIKKGGERCNTTSDNVDKILTTIRIERILTQHMMPYLQQQQYVHAIDEFISGINFFMMYGPPKFWEHIATKIMVSTNDQNNYHYELYLMLSMIYIWITIIWFNRYPLQRLYEQWAYNNSNNNNMNDWWWSRILRRSCTFSNMKQHHYQKLCLSEMNHAQQLRQRYYIQ